MSNTRIVFAHVPDELAEQLDRFREQSGLTLRAIVVASLSKVVGLEAVDGPSVDRAARRFRRA